MIYLVIKGLLILLALAFAFVVIALQNRKHQVPRRVQTIIQHERRMDIIGDGAWSITPARYPRSARVRDIEPRGA